MRFGDLVLVVVTFTVAEICLYVRKQLALVNLMSQVQHTDHQKDQMVVFTKQDALRSSQPVH